MDWGDTYLERFQSDRRAVRWWPLSVPIDSESGRRAIRLPGDRAGGPVSAQIAAMLGCNPNDCGFAGAPIISVNSASRLNTQIEEHLYKVIVIVDLDEAQGVNIASSETT